MTISDSPLTFVVNILFLWMFRRKFSTFLISFLNLVWCWFWTKFLSVFLILGQWSRSMISTEIWSWILHVSSPLPPPLVRWGQESFITEKLVAFAWGARFLMLLRLFHLFWRFKLGVLSILDQIFVFLLLQKKSKIPASIFWVPSFEQKFLDAKNLWPSFSRMHIWILWEKQRKNGGCVFEFRAQPVRTCV